MEFTFAEMRVLRIARRSGARMSDLCALVAPHSRAEVVEAVDALLRHPETQAALEHVNRVLDLQAQRVPLINGGRA